MSDHDTSDAALVARLREHHYGDKGLRLLMKEAADALARRIADGERLKQGIEAFLHHVQPAIFDEEDAPLSEVETSQVDTLATLVAKEPER